MTRSVSSSSRRRLAALGAGAALFFAGCADLENRPHVTSPVTPEASGPVFLPSPTAHAPVALGSLTASKFLKAADGGELTVGKAKVFIPKNALPRNMTVTVTVDPEYLDILVAPEGTVLRRPLRVTFTNLDQTDGQASQTGFHALVGGTWTQITSTRAGFEQYGNASSFGRLAVGTDEQGTTRWVRWLDGPDYQTRWVTIEQGGEVKFGRYKVTLDSGDLPYNAYVTVREMDALYAQCELEPHGIVFDSPVELEVDLSGLDWQPYTDWTIWWFNEDTDLWENQNGVFDGDKVYTDLAHFSVYRPGRGRAGW